tara:strand:- start:18 stop:467 length:450 start_codon:yes stop_codon:yes gene_type:complete
MQFFAEQNNTIDQNLIRISKDLYPLIDRLKAKGFKVKYDYPPREGLYGLFQSETKTLWISPVTFSLGIDRHTLLHEAAHAVQSCPYGYLTLIGWELPLNQYIKKEIQSIVINHYDSKNYLIEKEAFALQGQKNAVDLLIKALNQRCKDK